MWPLLSDPYEQVRDEWSENVTSFGIKRDCNWLDLDNVSHKLGSKNLQGALHPRRPRGSQSGQGKRQDESFQARTKEPLGTDSHRTISKNWSGCRLLIERKKCFVLLCPIGEQVSPEFFSWVRTRRLLSRHTLPVRSPSLCVQGKLLFSTFLTRNEGTTDESKKRLGCYQQEQFNLPREYSVFDGSQCIVNNRKFKMRRRRESQISNTFTWQNNNFARASRFFVHFFAVKCTTTRENA